MSRRTLDWSSASCPKNDQLVVPLGGDQTSAWLECFFAAKTLVQRERHARGEPHILIELHRDNVALDDVPSDGFDDASDALNRIVDLTNNAVAPSGGTAG